MRFTFGVRGIGGNIGAEDAKGGSVTAKHWFMFAGWQVAGSLVGFGAHHVDSLSWALSGLMLMPGTLLSFYIFREGGIGNSWDKWTPFAVAAALNTLLFVIIAIVRSKNRA